MNRLSKILISLIFIALPILVYVVSNFNPPRKYVNVYVPSVDKTYECLYNTRSIHIINCVQPNGKEIIIKAEYIIE